MIRTSKKPSPSPTGGRAETYLTITSWKCLREDSTFINDVAGTGSREKENSYRQENLKRITEAKMRMMEEQTQKECTSARGRKLMDKSKDARAQISVRLSYRRMDETVTKRWSCRGVPSGEPYFGKEGAIMNFANSIALEHTKCKIYSNLQNDN